MKKLSLLIAVTTALAGSLPLLAQAPYAADSNTLILYHFDEGPGQATVIDSSGNGRHATRGNINSGSNLSLPALSYSQTPTSGLSNRTNWTESVPPTDSDSILYSLGAQEFTIEAWVRFDALNFSGSNRFIMAVQSGTVVQPDLSFGFLQNSGGVYLALGDRNGANRVWTTGKPLDITIDQWYHVAVTGTPNADGLTSTYRFYFSSPGDTTTPEAFYTNTNTFMAPHAEDTVNRRLEIGNYYGSSGTSFFPGSIDEFRISNVARTTFETIPEPSHIALLMVGGAFLAAYRLKKRKA